MNKIQLTSKQLIAASYINPKVPDVMQVLYGGGAGGGKSFLGCLWLISMCTTYPGTRWLMGRSKLKTLKETTVNTFFDVMTMLNYPNKAWKYYDSSHIEFKNGSQIILKDLFQYPSDRDFNSLGSLEITGAFLDEVAQITRKAVEVVKARIRYKLGEFGLNPKMLLTCNPSKGWPFHDFYKPYIEGTLRPDRKFVQALLSDNPFVSPLYSQSLHGLEDITLKNRLLYGNWDYEDDTGTLVDTDAISDLFSNSFIYEPESDKYITADIALHGSDNFVVGIWKGLTLLNVIKVPKCDGEEIVSLLKDQMLQHKIMQTKLVYDSDGVGGYLRGYFPSAMPFVANSKPTKDNYSNLKAQCSFYLAKMINDRGIYIKDRKYKSEIETELLTIKKKRTIVDTKLSVISKEDVKMLLGRSPDFADMIMMRMYPEVKNTKRKSSFK